MDKIRILEQFWRSRFIRIQWFMCFFHVRNEDCKRSKNIIFTTSNSISYDQNKTEFYHSRRSLFLLRKTLWKLRDPRSNDRSSRNAMLGHEWLGTYPTNLNQRTARRVALSMWHIDAGLRLDAYRARGLRLDAYRARGLKLLGLRLEALSIKQIDARQFDAGLRPAPRCTLVFTICNIPNRRIPTRSAASACIVLFRRRTSPARSRHYSWSMRPACRCLLVHHRHWKSYY